VFLKYLAGRHGRGSTVGTYVDTSVGKSSRRRDPVEVSGTFC